MVQISILIDAFGSENCQLLSQKALVGFFSQESRTFTDIITVLEFSSISNQVTFVGKKQRRSRLSIRSILVVFFCGSTSLLFTTTTLHTVFSSKQSVDSLGDAQMTVDTDSTRPSSQYL